ncbi:MAG: hypothetical protein P8Y95_03725 [Gammaproteobacteria bacterium]
MTIEQLGSLGEFVGALGVIVTLAYLAFQVKQAKLMMRAQAAQARTDTGIQLMMSAYTNPAVWEATRKARESSELTPTERVFASGFLTAILLHHQNMLFQERMGLLDENMAALLRSTVRNNVNSPFAREMWENLKSQGFFGPAFVDHVERQLAEGDQQPGYKF